MYQPAKAAKSSGAKKAPTVNVRVTSKRAQPVSVAKKAAGKKSAPARASKPTVRTKATKKR